MDRGLAPSRQQARQLIEEGKVLVGGIPAVKPAAQIDLDRGVTLRDDTHQWVGRGARKLLGVLEPLAVDPTGAICADLGASTGGFTEVLLHRGAERVYAVDVGRSQLHERLAADQRVIVMDGINARHLRGLPEPIDLLVADLSFISIVKVLPAIARVLRPFGEAVLLVKPQFEVGKARVGSGGRVRDEADRQGAIAQVQQATEAMGFTVLGSLDSPVAGARSGNVEHFLHVRRAQR